MKAVLQRVSQASVKVEGKIIAQIGPGLVTLLGVAKGDDEAKILQMISKIVQLRCFEDDQGKMNRSLKDTGGEHLLISQFTLLGDCRKGTRPSFTEAEEPTRAEALYLEAVRLSQGQVRTQSGQFRAHMEVSLVNDGPVTLTLEI